MTRNTTRTVPENASPPTRVEERSTLGDPGAAPQARSEDAGSALSGARREARRARIHLVLGPVGAGKSTFALGLAREHAAVRLTLDEWMAALFSQDRPDAGVVEWYVERAARSVEQIGAVAKAIVDVGTDVVLEIGLIRSPERKRFCRRIDDAGLDLTIYVLDAAKDVRRERVNERNLRRGPTFSMLVPPAIFELASELWEPLDAAECEGRDVRFLRTDLP